MKNFDYAYGGITGNQEHLLASKIIPSVLSTYSGSTRPKLHGKCDYSSIAKWGANNIYSKCHYL